jgi:hypothetical protein
MAIPMSELLSGAEIEKITTVADLVVNPRFDPETIILSNHAIDRTKQRFPNIKGNPEARNYLRCVLRTAVFITEAYFEENEKHENKTKFLLYGAPNGVELRVSLDHSELLTIINHNGEIRAKAIPLKIREKMLVIFKQEIRKLNRIEKARQKKLPLVEAEVNADIANAKLFILKTTSKKKKQEAELKIKESEERLSKYIQEIEELQTKIKNTAMAMTTVL